MKYKCIILTIAVILSSGISSCQKEATQTDLMVEDFNANHYKWVTLYKYEKEDCLNMQKATALRKQTQNLWSAYKDSAQNIILQKKIVFIQRMAASNVMNSPASYEKNYAENTVTEKGQGAENENFTIFYLSDGTCVKASTKINPEWLGTTVGEKVLKVTGKKLTPIFQTMHYHRKNRTCEYKLNGYWERNHTLTSTNKFEYVEYTTYQPLYSN